MKKLENGMIWIAHMNWASFVELGLQLIIQTHLQNPSAKIYILIMISGWMDVTKAMKKQKLGKRLNNLVDHLEVAI